MFYKRDSQQMTTIAPPASRNLFLGNVRLRNIALFFLNVHTVKRFMEEVVNPSMEMVSAELKQTRYSMLYP